MHLPPKFVNERSGANNLIKQHLLVLTEEINKTLYLLLTSHIMYKNTLSQWIMSLDFVIVTIKVQSQKSKGLGVSLFCCCTHQPPPTKNTVSINKTFYLLLTSHTKHYITVDHVLVISYIKFCVNSVNFVKGKYLSKF